jgi:hypothetical protein
MSEKRLISRSSSRSSSRLFSQQAFESEIELTSSSIVESDVSERELQRHIRQILERQESFEILIETYVDRMFNIYRDHNIHDYNLWTIIIHDFADFKKEYWEMLSTNLWNSVFTICYTQEFWINRHEDRLKDNIKIRCMNMIVNNAYYEDWSFDRIQWVKKLYKKISSITQDRKNELSKTFNQVQFESSIQLSSSTQASSSFFSSITIISTTQNRISYESRTQYESNTRQNRYIDIRNQTVESQHENRSFNSESRFEDRDRQFNSELRQEDRSFNFESRYNRESNRLRNR